MFKTLWKIISLGREYRYWMALAALIGFLTVGSSIGLMMTSAYIIANAALHVHIHQLQVAIVGVRFFGISRGVFRYLERLVSHETTFKLLAKFRYWFFKSIEPLVPSKTVDFTSGDLLSRSVADIEKLEHVFVRVIAPPLIMLATLILMWFLLGIFGIAYSLIFTALYIGTAVVVPFLTYILSRKCGNKVIELNSQLNNISVDIVNGISELALYGQKRKWEQQFNSVQTELLKEEKKMNSIQGLNDSLIGLMMNVTVWVTLLAAIPEVTEGNLQGVSLSIIVIGIMAAYEALMPIPQAVQYLEETASAGNRLFEITEMAEDDKQKTISDKNALPKDYSIAFENVDFGYSFDRRVLKRLSLKFPEKGLTAVVGATGSGKSTLVNLITNLWKPNKGKVDIGGVDIDVIEESRLRSIMGIVPQKIDLFTGTIRDNLLVGDPDADEEKMYEALKFAELEEFVRSLPSKLDTGIGELGKTLSGGERKRLALARAVLRKPSIIICDEMNTGLDAVTEQKIISNLKHLSANKNIILITHRLTLMEKYDHIYVLHKGEIAESGSHPELLNKGGLYKKMYNSQHQIV